MKRLEAILSVILTLAAVVLAGSFAYRQFAARPQQSGEESTYDSHWRSIEEAGTKFGPENAKVVVMEFSDLECPFCKASHTTLRELMATYPGQIAYVFVHFPLPNHRFASLAARAAECARSQGRFAEVIDVLFEQQDSFGLRPWALFATDAGIQDTISFNTCTASHSVVHQIETGIALGKELHIRGTPTVWVNGWRLGKSMGPNDLRRIVIEALTGPSKYALRQE